jgi:hypothetical protein
LTRSEYQRWVRQGRPDLDKWIADGKPFLKGRRRAGLTSTPAAAVSKPSSPVDKCGDEMLSALEPVTSVVIELPTNTRVIRLARIGQYLTLCLNDGKVLHQFAI